MKYVASIVALVLALGLVGSQDARADTVSGRVVQIGAGGGLGTVYAGNVLGRKKDETYFVVFIPSAMGESASRLLIAASANHGLNQVVFHSVSPSGTSGFLYFAGPLTLCYMRNAS